MRTIATIPVLLNTFCVLFGICLSGCQSNGFHHAARSDKPDQIGGTVRIISGVKGPFQTYDEEFLNAVSKRWKDLASSRFASDNKPGKVVVVFKLHFDGQVTDLTTKETTVNRTFTLICQKAILDLAPYKRWTEEMHLMIGKDYREITFTFYYTDDSVGLGQIRAADKN